MNLTVYTVSLTKARIGFVEDSFSQQAETTVSNKNECITKITSDETSIPRFAQLQSEINTNNSTSVEQNCQPLAQNKLNNRQPISNLTDIPRPTKITSTRVVSKSHLISIIATHRLYIEKDHVTKICS